jgi:hypothetical protein
VPVNVLGNSVAALIVAQKEGALDRSHLGKSLNDGPNAAAGRRLDNINEAVGVLDNREARVVVVCGAEFWEERT